MDSQRLCTDQGASAYNGSMNRSRDLAPDETHAAGEYRFRASGERVGALNGTRNRVCHGGATGTSHRIHGATQASGSILCEEAMSQRDRLALK